MANPFKRLKRETRGQAVVETVLMLPLLLGMVFNAINFGFFFLVIINLAAAPRSGVAYSILGFSTPKALSLPPPGPTTNSGTVSYLTLSDLTGAIGNGSTSGVQVCSQTVIIGGSGTNGTGTSRKANCAQYNSSPAYPVDADPEAPTFVLNRVDVTYTFTPPLDQRLFNLVVLASPTCTGTGGSVRCTFHRQVSMRAMN